MQRRQSAETDLSDQQAHQSTPEMKAKLRECTEAEEQLRDIEARLGESASFLVHKTQIRFSSIVDCTGILLPDIIVQI